MTLPIHARLRRAVLSEDRPGHTHAKGSLVLMVRDSKFYGGRSLVSITAGEGATRWYEALEVANTDLQYEPRGLS